MLVTVDTGGTKTLVASFLEDGSIAKRVKFPTPKDQPTYVAQLVESIQYIADGGPIDAIVVAFPGVVKDNVAIWCPHLNWEKFDVRPPLKKQFGDIPVLVEHDANLGGLGEVRLLETPPPSALYVTISTGIGTGYITNGEINDGIRTSEGGHSLVEFDGVVQEWESFASGSAIYKTYGKYGKDIDDRRTWYQIADRISRGFLALVPAIQPDAIIIGGSMGTHFPKYADQLLGILREKLPAHIPVPQFIKARHPEEAVIYGCYFYALDTLAPKKA
jgi:predicted NBD/HSP70 family sugar kinase